MPRERIEDLGRLCSMLDDLCKHDLFDSCELFSKHYTIEQHLEKLLPDDRADFLWDLQYRINQVLEKISDMLFIAKGLDDLNSGD